MLARIRRGRTPPPIKPAYVSQAGGHWIYRVVAHQISPPRCGHRAYAQAGSSVLWHRHDSASYRGPTDSGQEGASLTQKGMVEALTGTDARLLVSYGAVRLGDAREVPRKGDGKPPWCWTGAVREQVRNPWLAWTNKHVHGHLQVQQAKVKPMQMSKCLLFDTCG